MTEPKDGIVSSIRLDQITPVDAWPRLGDSLAVLLICGLLALAIMRFFARTGR